LYANEAKLVSVDPVLDAKVARITSELRCLVCQNQTIADSHAELAVDLRNQVREMLQKGQTEEQITKYMTDRYGDFVLYRPPFNAATALLWFGPGFMVVGGLIALFLILRRRSRMAPEKFDPDDADANKDPHLS
jgi:cytochrome c-type biogenesis protein CcmH